MLEQPPVLAAEVKEASHNALTAEWGMPDKGQPPSGVRQKPTMLLQNELPCAN